MYTDGRRRGKMKAKKLVTAQLRQDLVIFEHTRGREQRVHGSHEGKYKELASYI